MTLWMNSDKKTNLNLNWSDDLSQSCDRPGLWSVASTFLSNYEAACHLFLHGASKQGSKSWVGVGLTAHREPGQPWRSGGKRPKVPVKKALLTRHCFIAQKSVFAQETGLGSFIKRTFLLLFSPSCSPAHALILCSCHVSSYMPLPWLCQINSTPFFFFFLPLPDCISTSLFSIFLLPSRPSSPRL